MKKISYALSILMLGVLASCGGKDKEDDNIVTLEVESQLGDLGEYAKINESEIKIQLVNEEQNGQETKTIVSSIALDVKEGVASNYSFDLSATILDENHIEIATLTNYAIDSNNNWDLEYHNTLSRGIVRGQMKFACLASDWTVEMQQKWDKIRTQGKYIVIKPFWGDNAKYEPYSSKSSVESVDESSDDSNSGSDDSASNSEEGFGVSNVTLPNALKGKVEVVSAKLGEGSYGYPEMTITFKLLSKVNTKPLCSAGGQMWIIGVGETASGSPVKSLLPNYKEWRSGDRDGSEFKDFLEGEPDDTITLEFTGSKDESSNVSADLELVKKFRLKLTK